MVEMAQRPVHALVSDCVGRLNGEQFEQAIETNAGDFQQNTSAVSRTSPRSRYHPRHSPVAN